MSAWQKYFLRKWLEALGLMSILGIIICIYWYGSKRNGSVEYIEDCWIVVSSVICFVLGFKQIIIDYPAFLSIQAKRQCYLSHIGIASVIGCVGLLIMEKLIFLCLEGSEFALFYGEQWLYRYNTLLLMTALGSVAASMFYRYTPMIAICLIGSFIGIGMASFAWGLLSSNSLIAMICNFYIMLLRGMTSVVGTGIYTAINIGITYLLLYRAPIAAYNQDLL